MTMTPETSETPQPAPAPQAVDPRRRLRELLSIPDRDRSDAEWDELNEIEIQLAPGNGATPVGNLAKKLPGGAKKPHVGNPGKGGHGQGQGQGQGKGQGQNRQRPNKGPKKKPQQQQA